MLLSFPLIYFIYRCPGSLPLKINLALILLIILVLGVKCLSGAPVVPFSLKLFYNN